MGPGERNSDDRHGKNDSRDEMAEREPPSGEQEPDQIADHAEDASAEVGLSGELIASNGPLTERQ